MKWIKACAVLFFLFAFMPVRAQALPYIIEYLMEPPNADPETGAVWNGRLWFYVEVDRSEANCFLEFKSLPVDTAEKPRDEFTARVPCTHMWEKPYLFGNENRLWLISPLYVGHIENGSLVLLESAQQLDSASKPFLYQGLPAVIEPRRHKLALMQFKDGRWHEGLLFRIGDGDVSEAAARRVQAIAYGDDLHLFWVVKDILYHYEGVPGEIIEDHEWTKVIASGCTWRGWEAVDLNGTPAVFYTSTQFLKRLRIKTYENGSWRSFPMDNEHNIILSGEYGFYPTGSGCDFLALVGNNAPTLFAVFHDGKLKAWKRFGSYPVLGTLHAMFLSTGVIFVLWILVEYFIKLFNPYWYYRVVTSNFIDARTMPVEDVNPDIVFSRDYSKCSEYIIRKWPKKNALTIRQKNAAETPLHIDKATLFFEQSGAQMRVRMVSKWALVNWALWAWACLLIYDHTTSFWDVMGPLKTILVMGPFAALVLWAGWRLFKGAGEKVKNKMKGDLDVILKYLGVGEQESGHDGSPQL